MNLEIKNKSLFAISSELTEIFNQLEESGGELTPELEQALQISKAELKSKSLNYVHYIKKLENDLELVKVYEEQLEAFKKRKERILERLKDSLKTAVEQFGEIEADIFKITTRKSESVEVINENEIPPQFYISMIVKTLDKKRVKEAIKNGEEVPGAIIKENKNLSIK